MITICFSLYFFLCCEWPDQPEPTIIPDPTPESTATPAPAPATLQACISNHLWSPDSSQVAVVINSDPWDCDLWIVDKELKNFRLVKHGEVKSIYGWQGDWILFNKDREEGLPDSYYGGNEIWKIRTDGSEEIQLTDTFSDGNGIRTEYWNQEYDNVGTVRAYSFIPGTDSLYFQACNGNGWVRSYICPADGTSSWQHVSYPDYAWRCAVSPAGNKLFFAHGPNYYLPLTIKSANPDGSEIFPIIGNLSDFHFIILADGSGVVFRKSDNIIRKINIDGSNECIILDDEYNNTLAVYGRNGDEILIYSDRTDGNQHIYSLNVVDSTVTQLTSGDYNDFYPVISPDGLYLAYRRLPVTYSGITTVPYYELVIKSLD